MKQIILTLMMLVAVSAIMSAQEVQTAEPIINLFMNLEPYEQFYYDQFNGNNYQKDCFQHYYLVADIISVH